MRISMARPVVQEYNGVRVEFLKSPTALGSISQKGKCIAFCASDQFFLRTGPGQANNICKACSGGPGASQKRMQSMNGRALGKPNTYAKHARAGCPTNLGPCSKEMIWETSAAARCGPNARRPRPTNAEY